MTLPFFYWGGVFLGMTSEFDFFVFYLIGAYKQLLVTFVVIVGIYILYLIFHDRFTKKSLRLFRFLSPLAPILLLNFLLNNPGSLTLSTVEYILYYLEFFTRPFGLLLIIPIYLGMFILFYITSFTIRKVRDFLLI